MSVIAGYEGKRLFSLSTYEVICKSPRSIEFLQFFTSFSKIWTIGPKIESKMGKERQFAMERPEPHPMTLIVISICISSGNIIPQFWPFSLYSICPPRRFKCLPRNATQLPMCLGNLCTEMAAVT